MLDSLLLGYAMLFAGIEALPGLKSDEKPVNVVSTNLAGFEDPTEKLMVSVDLRPMKDAKMSPKGEWSFSHLALGFGRKQAGEAFFTRFRLFAENEADLRRVAGPMTRQLLRQWDFNVTRLRLDHAPAYYQRLVDVYLAREGSPGGEHRFDMDPFITDSGGKPERVNTIYIYKVDSFREPFEMAREVAHEYGHATLPPVGGYDYPEEWVNGDMGERLYLMWLAEAMAAGKAVPEDAMGATRAQLESYVQRNVTPLVRDAMLNGPNQARLARRDKSGFEAFLGQFLYSAVLLPRPVLARAVLLGTQTQKGTGYPAGVVEAMSEREEVELRKPAGAGSSPIWIPLGKGTIRGAKVLSRSGGWARIQPTAEIMMIRNPALPDN